VRYLNNNNNNNKRISKERNKMSNEKIQVPAIIVERDVKTSLTLKDLVGIPAAAYEYSIFAAKATAKKELKQLKEMLTAKEKALAKSCLSSAHEKYDALIARFEAAGSELGLVNQGIDLDVSIPISDLENLKEFRVMIGTTRSSYYGLRDVEHKMAFTEGQDAIRNEILALTKKRDDLANVILDLHTQQANAPMVEKLASAKMAMQMMGELENGEELIAVLNQARDAMEKASRGDGATRLLEGSKTSAKGE